MKIPEIPKKLLLGAITIYQRSLSPDHGWLKARHPHGYCRFFPSCSEYARQAVEKHGAAKGAALAASRLLRCHPWAEPQIDNVPVFKK